MNAIADFVNPVLTKSSVCGESLCRAISQKEEKLSSPIGQRSLPDGRTIYAINFTQYFLSSQS